MALLVHNYLLFFILPLWIAAGFADYLNHRATRIEHTSGTREAVIHALMIVELGVPLLLALFFEINALILAIMLVALVIHEATGYWDLVYAHQSEREVRPFEQHVHSFLEVLPLMAVSFVVVLNWEQFLALFGLGAAEPDFALRYKADYWRSGYAAVLLAVVFVFSIVPFADELRRCMAADARRKAGTSYG